MVSWGRRCHTWIFRGRVSPLRRGATRGSSEDGVFSRRRRRADLPRTGIAATPRWIFRGPQSSERRKARTEERDSPLGRGALVAERERALVVVLQGRPAEARAPVRRDGDGGVPREERRAACADSVLKQKFRRGRRERPRAPPRAETRLLEGFASPPGSPRGAPANHKDARERHGVRRRALRGRRRGEVVGHRSRCRAFAGGTPAPFKRSGALASFSSSRTRARYALAARRSLADLDLRAAGSDGARTVAAQVRFLSARRSSAGARRTALSAARNSVPPAASRRRAPHR